MEGESSEAAVRDARKRSILDPLDALLSELREEFPGWDVWYVPRVVGSTTWCAKPKPLLNCGSPDELRVSIRRADQRRLTDLASQAAGDDVTPEDGTPPGVTELPRRRRPDGVA